MAEVISFELLNRIAGEEGFLWQFDYGQKMKFDGVELPASYTVHFANSSAGDSVPQIGDETGVSIPDQVLTSGKTVYFWLFLHPDATSGQTAYANMIKVHPRTALPTIEPPTPEEQSILDQLMATLEAGVAHVDGVASGMQQQIEDELARAKASGEFKGDPGAVFTPEVDGQGILSWENNGGLPNPDPVDMSQILNLDAYEKKEDLAADIGKGQARGVAELDEAGKVPSSQLPSYVDDVVEYPSVAQFPVPGESGKIYISTSNNHAYRWGGTRYFDISAVDVSGKADKRDTVLETTLSRGRKENTTSGEASFAFGENVTASGVYSHAEGQSTTASGAVSHAEGFLTVADGNLSHAEGYKTTAIGIDSHAEGSQTLAYADNSHSEGFNTAARNSNAHAEGSNTNANGVNSHAEGYYTIASEVQAHAEGYYTTASGEHSHAEGTSTIASGHCSHAEGNSTSSSGQNSHAEGLNAIASGSASHAEGVGGTVNRGDYTESSEANGYASHTEGYQARVFASGSAEIYGGHAEGHKTRASSQASHAEGNDTYADGVSSHSEGYGTRSQGNQSHAEGNQTKANGTGSHSEGYNTESRSDYSHAEGINTVAVSTGSHAEGMGGSYTHNGITYYGKAEGSFAHAEGMYTATNGTGAHAEGSYTRANSYCAHAEGEYTLASASTAHAEGEGAEATAYAAHAEGYGTKASAYCSHAEGYLTEAKESFAHSEGYQTIASGAFSHTEGQFSEAIGYFSHAEGYSSKAVGRASHTGGKYNVADNYTSWPDWEPGTYAVGAKVRRLEDNVYVGYICLFANSDQSWNSAHWSKDYDYNYVEIIGNGSSDGNRSNARALDWDGNERLKGDLYVHCNSSSSGGVKIEPVTYMTLADAQAIINNYGVSA